MPDRAYRTRYRERKGNPVRAQGREGVHQHVLILKTIKTITKFYS